MIPRFAILAAALAVLGCATYSEDFRPVRRTAMAGNPGEAVAMLNERLGTEAPPTDLEGDAVLWLLERATLRQGLGAYEASANDLAVADRNLEVLDVTRANSTEIARYLYSDSAVTYRAPPHERILLNALNAVNFLALGDWSGARVEARRFRVFEDYLENAEDRDVLVGTLGLGNYVAGLVFELSRDYGSAARHYARAWRFGLRGGGLEARIVGLLRTTGASVEGEELAALADTAREAGPLDAEEYAREFVDGQLVAFVQTGWAPAKEPVRVNLAEALLWVGVATSDSGTRVAKLVAEGAVKWINFPVVVTADLPPPAEPDVAVDGQPLGDAVGASVARAVVAEYERTKGTAMIAALTRLLTRIVAGEATEAVVEKTTEKKGEERESGKLLGWLANLAVQASLSALDRPDTRSWSLLPGHVRIYRTRLPPGEHRISLTVRDGREDRTLTMTRHGVAVVNFSRLR